MAEENRSQAQQNNPFLELVEEQVKQVGSFYGELDRIASDNLERAQAAVDEMARLTKESFAYGARLATEWRRLGLEVARRGAETVSSTTRV